MNNRLISPRESEALKYLALGLSNGEIAHVMSISDNTARTYLESIKQHTGIRSRVLLAIFARKYGYVTQEEMDMALDNILHAHEA